MSLSLSPILSYSLNEFACGDHRLLVLNFRPVYNIICKPLTLEETDTRIDDSG